MRDLGLRGSNDRSREESTVTESGYPAFDILDFCVVQTNSGGGDRWKPTLAEFQLPRHVGICSGGSDKHFPAQTGLNNFASLSAGRQQQVLIPDSVTVQLELTVPPAGVVVHISPGSVRLFLRSIIAHRHATSSCHSSYGQFPSRRLAGWEFFLPRSCGPPSTPMEIQRLEQHHTREDTAGSDW